MIVLGIDSQVGFFGEDKHENKMCLPVGMGANQ